MTNSTQDILRALTGSTIQGGCDTCDAYQTMTEDPKYPGVFHLSIHHDDWCPVLAKHRGVA